MTHPVAVAAFAAADAFRAVIRERLTAELAHAECPASPRELDLATLLVQTRGEACSLGDVYDTWSVWQARSGLRTFAEIDQAAVAQWTVALRDAIVATAFDLSVSGR